MSELRRQQLTWVPRRRYDAACPESSNTTTSRNASPPTRRPLRLSLSQPLSLFSFMCLISGDSIVGAAPSPKLSPRPGRRASGPARKSRQPRPKPLCLRVCFLRDRQSSTTTLLKSSVKCHKCVLPTCNTIQPSMAAADLQSQQRRDSNNTRGTWPDPAP